jgi:hypothetical protein
MAKVEVVRNEALAEAASKDGNLTRATRFQHGEVRAGYARVGGAKIQGGITTARTTPTCTSCPAKAGSIVGPGERIP